MLKFAGMYVWRDCCLCYIYVLLYCAVYLTNKDKYSVLWAVSRKLTLAAIPWIKKNFARQLPFLSPSQQCQTHSTEGRNTSVIFFIIFFVFFGGGTKIPTGSHFQWGFVAVMRSVYKDLLLLMTRNRLLTTAEIRRRVRKLTVAESF